MVTQSFLGWTSLRPVHSLCLSLFSIYLLISFNLSLSRRKGGGQQKGLNVMALEQREKGGGGRERDRKNERKRERSCLPCSLGDSALASLQLTCTGLPKAAASQATVPKLASHWMGGAPCGSTSCTAALYWPSSWSSRDLIG